MAEDIKIQFEFKSVEINTSNLPSTSKKRRCVVWGCDSIPAHGYGMFSWPKDDKMASLWTKRVQNTRAYFKGPGYHGSKNPLICGKHFETTCFTKSCLLKAKMGFKTCLKLEKGAIPSIFPKPSIQSSGVSWSPKKTRKSGGAYEKRERKRVIAELLACMDAEPAKDDKIKRGRGILGKQMLSSQSIASDGTVVKTELEGSSSPQELTAAEKTDLTASTLLQQLTAASQKNKSSDLGQHFLSRDTNKITSTTAPIICGIDVMAPQATQVLQIVPNSEHIPCNDSMLEAATKDKTVTTNKGIVYSVQLEYPELPTTEAREKVLNEHSIELMLPKVTGTVRVNNIQYEVCKECNGCGFVEVTIQDESSNGNTEVENLDGERQRTASSSNATLEHSHDQILPHIDHSNTADAGQTVSPLGTLQIKREPPDLELDTVEMVDEAISESVNRTKCIIDSISEPVSCELSSRQIQGQVPGELSTPMPPDMSQLSSAHKQEPRELGTCTPLDMPQLQIAKEQEPEDLSTTMPLDMPRQQIVHKQEPEELNTPSSDPVDEYTKEIQPPMIELYSSSCSIQPGVSDALGQLNSQLVFSCLGAGQPGDISLLPPNILQQTQDIVIKDNNTQSVNNSQQKESIEDESLSLHKLTSDQAPCQETPATLSAFSTSCTAPCSLVMQCCNSDSDETELDDNDSDRTLSCIEDTKCQPVEPGNKRKVTGTVTDDSVMPMSNVPSTDDGAIADEVDKDIAEESEEETDDYLLSDDETENEAKDAKSARKDPDWSPSNVIYKAHHLPKATTNAGDEAISSSSESDDDDKMDGWDEDSDEEEKKRVRHKQSLYRQKRRAMKPKEPAKELKCTLCDYVSTRKRYLYLHERSYHNIKTSYMYSCETCGKGFLKRNSLNYHRSIDHGMDMEYISYLCSTCGMSFSHRFAYRLHLQTHDDPVKCLHEGCNAMFKTKYARNSHNRTIHLRKYEVICPYEGCNRSFKVKSRLMKHISGRHKKLKPFTCTADGCDKKFATLNSRSVHLRTHTNIPYLSCHYCNYTCRQRNALNWHMKKHPETIEESKTK